MAQGNPNKVNAIVDEIVENNNVFKLKSPIEQDKEKDSIAQSINSAISVLNEVGKELVLQELSVDPDEKFKGFIDSVGNVDVSGLSQMTATIVKEKIIEAEKEGIDLRQGQSVFKDNTKSLLVGGVLTVAVIDTMIKNYDNLSNEDIGKLIFSYPDMSTEQQQAFNHAQAESTRNLAQSIEDAETEGNLEKQADILDGLVNSRKQKQENFNSNPNQQINIIKGLKDKIVKHRVLLERFLANGIDIGVEIPDIKFPNGIESIEEWISKDSQLCYNALLNLSDFYTQLDIMFLKENVKLYQSGKISKEDCCNNINRLVESSIELNQEESLEDKQENLKNEKDEKQPQKNEQKLPKKVYEQKDLVDKFRSDNSKTDVIEPTEENKTETLESKLLQEIEQLPIALAKSNFSQEDIMEAMKQYKTYFEDASNDDFDFLAEQTKEDRSDILKEEFEGLNVDEKTKEILKMMSELTFDGNMQQILTNSEVREQFLAQFDKVIEQGINLDQDVKLDGELAQIFSQYFKDNAEEMDISAIEEQKEQVTDEQVKQEEPKEMFSFIDSEYLKQDSIEGLIPRNGENSQSLQDDKKAIFYSQGKEGAIVMYFEFLKQYERLKGSAGDKALERYANYKNGTIELSDEQVQLLQGQLKQITQMRETKDFDEFMGDKIYLKLNGIDTEQDRQAAEEWRASHPGTRMDYNYANSWTNSAISPDRIDVVSLQSKDGKDVRTSQKDLIKYFLSQTSIDKIEELGVNDTTLENIRKYYQEHSAEIAQMGEEYSVVTQNIQEFEQSRESKEAEKQFETRETEITAPEIEKHEENLPAKQDNSFLGKIKRVFANMKDMKNKDNSKGFFARLGASIQTVFGNKKDEFDEKQDENITSSTTQRKEQTRECSKQTNYLTQHFDVNEKQAVQDLKKKQDAKDKDSQLSQDDQEFGNL